MRYLIDLSTDQDGRVSGQVEAADQPPIPFSGWLELLRVLEGHADANPRKGQETSWDG